MRTLLNTYLGQYWITEVIGRGSTATVYKAFQPSLQRSVAIKVLPGQLNPQLRRRFQREAQAIALLQHPNILPIYDFVQQDDLDYFVMQYVERAVTLNEQLAQGPMPLASALRLIARVLDALEYAHAHGVIHRDIKPSNILMPRPDWPLLADFGIAKMRDASQELTPVGQIIGTVSYMAPEQMSGQPSDARSDIYAVGIVLYELVTGQVPFDAPTALGVLMKHVNEPLPPPSSINPVIPASVEAVIARALEKDPGDRYQSAGDMRAAIGVALNTIDRAPRRAAQAADARRTMPIYSQPPARSAEVTGATSAAATAAAPFVPHMPPQPRQAAPDQNEEQHAAGKARTFRILLLALAGMVALLLIGRALSAWLPRMDSAPSTAAAPTNVSVDTAPPIAAAIPPEAATATPSAEELTTAVADATAQPGAPETPGTYVVQPGDTLSDIAERFGTTVEALLAANNLSDPNLVEAGQSLIVPAQGENMDIPTAAPAPTQEQRSPSAESTAVPNPAPLDASGVVRLEDTDWIGGFRPASGRTYGGRSATWIYGTTTEYATMQAVFSIASVSNGAALLRIEGMDSEGRAKTPIRIAVNGVEIFSGENPLPDDDVPLETGTWATHDFPFDASLLRPGENEIRISNLAEGAFSQPPFFMLDYAQLIYSP